MGILGQVIVLMIERYWSSRSSTYVGVSPCEGVDDAQVLGHILVKGLTMDRYWGSGRGLEVTMTRGSAA